MKIMKKHFFLLLLAVMQTTGIVAQDDLFLQIDEPEYVDLNNSGERIDKVITKNSRTLVYMSCSGASETNVIVPQNTYIVDEKGEKYNVIKAKGLTLGTKKKIGKGGRLSYILTFPSLPKGTKSFDLVQSHNMVKTYYFNIHQAGSKGNIDTVVDTVGTYEAINKTYPDNMFRKSTVRFSGRFKGSKIFESGRYAISFVTPIPSLYGKEFTKQFDVNPDGTFTADIPVFGPTWTELIVLIPGTSVVSRTIPVMLCPGDNLSLVVEDYDSEFARYSWTSKFDYNEKFVGLCDVFPARHPVYREGQSLNIDSLKQTITASEQVACYLSRKYNLSKAERALLLTQANMSKVCEALRTIDQNVLSHKSAYFKSLNNAYPTPAQFDTLQTICKSQLYSILSLLYAENKAFLIAPSLQSLTRIINASPLFHSITYSNNYFSIPKDYRLLYCNDNAVHLLRIFRDKSIGKDRLFEQWFRIADMEAGNDFGMSMDSLHEAYRMKTEAVTLSVFSSWKSELLNE